MERLISEFDRQRVVHLGGLLRPIARTAAEHRQHEKGQKSPILHFFRYFSGLYVSYHSPEALRLKGHIPVSTNVEHPARTGKHVMTNFRNVMTNSGSRMWDFKPQNSIFCIAGSSKSPPPMKHNRITLYVDLLFCLVIMPLVITLFCPSIAGSFTIRPS